LKECIEFVGLAFIHGAFAGIKSGGKTVVGPFEFLNLTRSHREEPAFLPAGRGISRGTQPGSGDPSLRLKNGYAQDDAINEGRGLQEFNLTHYWKNKQLTKEGTKVH
jgi:hypothetical protein